MTNYIIPFERLVKNIYTHPYLISLQGDFNEDNSPKKLISYKLSYIPNALLLPDDALNFFFLGIQGSLHSHMHSVLDEINNTLFPYWLTLKITETLPQSRTSNTFIIEDSNPLWDMHKHQSLLKSI